jgi:hypothetical protein
MPDGQPDKEVARTALPRKLQAARDPVRSHVLHCRPGQPSLRRLCAATHTHLCVSEVELISKELIFRRPIHTTCVKWTTLSL